MNRRDMLHESLRSAARSLPAMMGTLTVLAGLLKNGEAREEHASASCFPSGRAKANTGNTPITHDEEGKK